MLKRSLLLRKLLEQNQKEGDKLQKRQHMWKLNATKAKHAISRATKRKDEDTRNKTR